MHLKDRLGNAYISITLGFEDYIHISVVWYGYFCKPCSIREYMWGINVLL